MNYCGKVIQKGSTDDVSVKAIKVRLNEVINAKLDVLNGNFGPSTESAVKSFQKLNHLLQDGKVGELTWQRLFTVKEPVSVESNKLSERAIETAKTQLKVREKTNHNDGVDVEKYLKSVGLGAGFAWCMAFLYWCFFKSANEIGVACPVPRTAGVLDCYSKAKKAYLVSGNPKAGDQFIMDFGKGQGHTGIVTEFKNGRIYTVEGNTSADPAYAGEDREGNGVFERNRPVSSIKAFLRYE